MIIETNDIEINVVTKNVNALQKKIPILFLHGFTGCAEDWLFIFDKLNPEFEPFAIDLIGHGKTSSPKISSFYSTYNIIKNINSILDYLKIKSVILVGYSMGGRAALAYTINYPGRVNKLILESSTAGITNEIERKRRIKQDNDLANFIEQNSIENFINHWFSVPLFQSLKKLPLNTYNKIVEGRKFNNKTGLANSLRGFGTGKMPNYWGKLHNLKTNTLLISGDLDNKFTTINKKLSSELPNAKHVIVKNTGHNLHLEKPQEFIIFLNRFLNN